MKRIIILSYVLCLGFLISLLTTPAFAVFTDGDGIGP